MQSVTASKRAQEAAAAAATATAAVAAAATAAVTAATSDLVRTDLVRSDEDDTATRDAFKDKVKAMNAANGTPVFFAWDPSLQFFGEFSSVLLQLVKG